MADRTYRQFCGVARGLDILGGRWTLLLVRNLLLGPRRYGTLLAELPGITTNLLASRLQHLEAAGLVRKEIDDGGHRWALTSEGLLLEPIVMELGRFGARSLKGPLPGERVDVGWGLLSLKRRYRGGERLEVELRVRNPEAKASDGVDGERTFSLSFTPTYLRVRDQPSASPILVVTSTSTALREVFFGGASAAPFINDGAIVVVGDEGLWLRFLGAFAPTPLPNTGGPDPAISSAHKNNGTVEDGAVANPEK